jgi:hypothetical protein
VSITRKNLGIGCLAAAILGLFLALCFEAARDKSPAYDEPGLMLAGYSYVARDCPEIPAENLRLSEMWIGLPLLALKPRIPDALRREKNLVIDQKPSELGALFVYDPANRTEAMLMASRMAVAAAAVALGWMLFAASRRLHGPAAGLLTLILYCLNPVIISNSALATTDLVTALVFTVAAAAYWRLIHRPTLVWTAAFGISFGALLTTKFTSVVFPAIAAVLLAVRLAAGPRPVRVWRLALVNAAAAVVAYGVIWLVYGFHYTHGAPLAASVWAQTDSGFAARLVDVCRRGHLLPEAYLFDVHVFLWKVHRLVFFMGRYSWAGFWSFFPLVIFFKTPPALLLALCLAVAAAVLVRRRNPASSPHIDLYGLAPFLATGIVYGAIAVESRFNIGIRHILPVFPMLFVVAGVAARLPFRRRWQAAVIGGVILTGSVVEVLIARPNYLAYVNEFGGGPRNGWRLFVDSSYDWGQDLPAVRRWIDARVARPGADRPVYFSYFGNGLIDHYGIRAFLLPQDIERRALIPAVLEPGTYIICATMLQGIGIGSVRGPWQRVFEESYQALGRELPSVQMDTTSGYQAFHLYELLRFARLCAYLRTREPDAWITPNVLVYELDQKSLAQALSGPPRELVDKTSIIGAPPD